MINIVHTIILLRQLNVPVTSEIAIFRMTQNFQCDFQYGEPEK